MTQAFVQDGKVLSLNNSVPMNECYNRTLIHLPESIRMSLIYRQEELYHECRDYRIWKYGEDVGG